MIQKLNLYYHIINYYVYLAVLRFYFFKFKNSIIKIVYSSVSWRPSVDVSLSLSLSYVMVC